MNVLIIGSGGREHALLDLVVKSGRAKKIFVAPGNAGMATAAECVAIPPENIELLTSFALKNEIGLTIVGPELPLTLGIVDAFEAEGLRILGPNKKASVLEGSKIFTKEFAERHGIPTAPFHSFEDMSEVKSYLKDLDTYPVVIKADGLASGKGVIIANSYEEADKAVTEMMLYERFGTAGRRILVEDFLTGEEASFIVLTDGENFLPFPAAQDHKRAFDNDAGPNTGGMGAYAPAPLVDSILKQKIIDQVIKPTLAGMRSEDRPYRGFLYAGLMISPDGVPNLIEFNCRFGDPEAEAILPLLDCDFLSLCEAVLDGKLDPAKACFSSQSCVAIVLASRGYPDSYRKGFAISGLGDITDPDVRLFHAGTRQKDETFVTDGGRVLVVSAKDTDLQHAIKKAYVNVTKINWEGMHYRKDIGAKANQGCES